MTTIDRSNAPKYIIHLLFIFQLLISGCENILENRNIDNSSDTIKNESTPLPSSNTNVIDQSSVQPYKGIDSLVRIINKNFAFSEVKRLDSICLTGDGDLPDYLGSITISFFDDHLNDFLAYSQKILNPV